MGFKSDTQAPVPVSRTRNHDPQMIREVEKLLDGRVTRILATGDESKSTNAPKGKQSEREKSARAEASKVAHYIRTKHPEFGPVATIWLRDAQAVQVASKATENGSGTEGAE